MIPDRIIGSEFAKKRYARYDGHVVWKFHSEYYGRNIERAYHSDSGNPCGLYRVQDGLTLIVGENLLGVKAATRDWVM